MYFLEFAAFVDILIEGREILYLFDMRNFLKLLC